jgi:hypothetical protein
MAESSQGVGCADFGDAQLHYGTTAAGDKGLQG